MYGLPKRKNAANGGLIEGPGTGTSDSINKDVPAGTYIMPADTTAQLGLGVPGRNGQAKAEPEQPRLGMPGRQQVPVAVSNGEYEVPPQDVHALGAVVLDQLKNATHEQKGFGLTRAVMAAAKGRQDEGPRQFFVDGGLVDDRERRGFGLNLPTTTLAQQNAPRLGVPSNRPAQAQTESAPTGGGFGVQRPSPQPGADQQPRLGMPRRSQTPAVTDAPRLGMPGAARKSGSGLLDVPAGIGQAAAGIARLPVAAGQDALRNAAAYAVGGNPDSLPGGAARYRDEALGRAREGIEQVGSAVEGVRAAGREALGIQPRTSSAAVPAESAAPASGITPERVQAMAREAASPIQPSASAPATTAEPSDLVSPQGNGYTQAGNGIAMRTGADGSLEFTNDAAALSGARTMPAGGMNRVGDGVGGGLSVGDPGDSETAIARFQRANDIRQQTLAENRGTVTGLTDNSGRPTLAERQRANLDLQQAQSENLRAQTQQAGADANLRRESEAQRMGTEQLNQQRLQQQIAEGNIGVQDRQRLDQLRAQINDPSLSEQERAQALDAYNALSITPDARLKAQQEANSQQQRVISDLYKSFSSLQTPPTIGEGNNARPMSFEEWLQPALRAIQGGGQQAPVAGRQAPAVGTQQGGYEFIGGDPASPSSWRRV